VTTWGIEHHVVGGFLGETGNLPVGCIFGGFAESGDNVEDFVMERTG